MNDIKECNSNLSDKLHNLSVLEDQKYNSFAFNNLTKIREKFKYYFKNDAEDNPTCDYSIKTFQKRVISYSDGIITEKFPFNPEKYIIAGGFVVNTILGIFSDYTDIDIYIFEDFEDSVKTLVNYFQSFLKIEMTTTKSVINIYAICYKINIQLIYLELKPEKIIEDFDLTYSQMAIYNWNDVKLTSNAVEAILTGYFKLNVNTIIRPYRILKGYIKGFKLNDSDFNYEENEQNFKFGLLDDVKFMLSSMKKVKDDDDELENTILDFLADESNEYKFMTKHVYLGEEIESMTVEQKKIYIEELTMCQYFMINTFNPERFESLKYYSYQYDFNRDNSISSFPCMQKIVIGNSITGLNYKKILQNKETIYLYRLVVNTGEYYPNPISLTNFQFSFDIKLKDIKLVGVSSDNTSLKFIIDYSNISEKKQLKNLIANIDARMLHLAKEIFKYQPKIQSNIIFESFGKIKNKSMFREENLLIASSNPISFCKYIEQSKSKFYNSKSDSDSNDNFTNIQNNNNQENTININILKKYICNFRELLYSNKSKSQVNYSYPRHHNYKIKYIRLSTLLPHEMKPTFNTHKIKVYVNGLWYNKKENKLGYNLSILF
jgi:hypothetical protein